MAKPSAPVLPTEELLTVLEPLAGRPRLIDDPVLVGELSLPAAKVIEILAPLARPERMERFIQVIKSRTRRVVPVLERIYDRGNISAVMRSAESFGFLDLYLIEPEKFKYKAANRVTKGSDKWLDVHLHRSTPTAIKELRSRGFRVYATHLDSAVDISTVDFAQPTAVVFGSEKDGVSSEMLDLCDGRFKIPMVGFSQSFNISVAAALTLYHAYQERVRQLGKSGDLSPSEQQAVLAAYLVRNFDNPEQLLRQALKK